MFFPSRRFLKMLFSLVGLVLVSAAAAQERPPICEQIAKTYGLDSFSQVEQIRYNFNVDLGKVQISRSWIWEPKTDRVSYQGKDKDGKPVKANYLRSQMTEDQKKEIDPAFINDQYWLLFPLHLSWDKAATVEDKGMAKMPGGKGGARRVVVSYPKQGGYTPGDSYELFVGKDNVIRAWIYHEGGAAKPSLTATWADTRKAGPLLIALDHRGTHDGKPIRIFFTGVAVKLAGSDAWVNAQ